MEKQVFEDALADAIGTTTCEAILAEDEHLRWNAYHSLQAYDYMFIRKIWDNAHVAGMKLVKV